MRTIVGCIAMLWGSISLFGQSAEEMTIRLKQENNAVVESAHPMDGEQDRTKGHLGISVGTSFSAMQGYGSGMMFYAVPSYTLPLNNRWALHGGLIAAGYQGFNTTVTGEYPFPSQFTSLALFAAASYRLNDRLVLHGAGVKQLMAAPVTPFTPYPSDHFSLGATYKLGENISIGATIHMNNGGGNYPNPLNRYGFQPPFYW